ncbi:MAG: amino acid adenylation domain-containing protein [Cellvibrionaceae bacterium]|nr:amino acid adenylation domain-containing protein [Cellvibrionaceae bacterium]
MSLADLLKTLDAAGVSLRLHNDQLLVEAEKGKLTAAMRERLVSSKAELMRWLGENADSNASMALPQCIPDVDNLYQPFMLTDLQQGFYLAEDEIMEFHVRPHYYTEKTYKNFRLADYKQAWHKAIKRHEKAWVILRAEGELQLLDPPASLSIAEIDLRATTVALREQSLLATRNSMSRQQLPLDRWPVFDLRISYWEEQGMVVGRMHYNHNNFFADGGGTARFLREIDAYYENPALIKPPLSLGVRDAVIALDALSQSSAGQADRQYWMQRLPHFPDAIALLTLAHKNRRCRSYLQRRHYFLSADAWQRLQHHAENNGITASNAIFAAYVEVLSAWSNQSHFIISNMMTRRLPIHAEIRDIMGNFASLYPLEVRLDPTLPFARRALALQQQVYRDAQHLRWGGMAVMRALNKKAERFACAPLPFVIGSGLFMDKLDPPEFSCLETPQVMLDHQFWELRDGRYYFVWDVLEAFFPAGLLDAMAGAYSNFLEQLADDAANWQRNHIDFLPPSQLARRRMPAVRALASTRLESWLTQAAQQRPEQTAIRVGEQSLRCGQLASQSARVAYQLAAAGVQAGDCVALVMNRGMALAAAVYGVLRAGGAYVPIEPGLPKDRRQYLIVHSQTKLVLTQRALADELTWPADVQLLVVDDLLAQPLSTQRVEQPRSADDLAYVIYTSGSTGLPKGVMIQHRAVVNTLVDINQRFAINHQDRLFGVSSFAFDLSVYDLFGSMASGALLVYPPADDALNPSRWLDIIASEGITVWNSAPSLALLLVETAEVCGVSHDTVRLVLLSGDWIPLDLPKRLCRVFPRANIVSLGGATEASIWSIYYEITRCDPAWVSIPYGYPMANQSWFILDYQGRAVPDWVVGDLYIGGAGLAQGYWRDGDKTRDSFVPHPQTGERIYRTGDLGRYHPSGYIEFMGRRDSQIKLQGHRIELGEIEKVLSLHPAVKNCVVLARAKAHSTTTMLCAFYVLETTEKASDEAALQTYLAAKLPDYMMPRAWLLVEQLPLTPNGKIDRNALCDLPLPDRAVKQTRVAPSTATEKTLFCFWEKILGRSDFGVDDDFFDLGGQSFEAVMLVGQLAETFGLSLSLGDIWALRTIKNIAKKLAVGTTADTGGCLVALDAHGDGQPLFLVHPAGGNLLCYRTLAQQLKRPVFGLQAPGIKGETVPLQSITAFADHYAPLIAQRQPQGDIVVGGWSSGALIAYAVAVKLQALGRRVAGIVMIDSPAPLCHDKPTDDELFRWFVADLGLPAPVLAAVERQSYRNSCRTMTASAAIATLCQILKEQQQPLADQAAQLAIIFAVFKGVVTASRAYLASPLNVDIKLFKATQGTVDEFISHPYSDVAHWGWGELSTAKVDAEFIEGSHYTLLQSPQVFAIGNAIEQWLDVLKNNNQPS